MEVGIGGVALGLIMLRWGILPTLAWHYSMDAMYSAMLLLRSHSLYFKLSGAASAGIVALPVLVALAAYWLRGGFEPETGLLNADEPSRGGPPAQARCRTARPGVSAYRPLRARMGLAARRDRVACLLTLLIPVSRFGDAPKFKLTAGQARAAADAFLRAQASTPPASAPSPFPRPLGRRRQPDGQVLSGAPAGKRASGLFERYRPAAFWDVALFQTARAGRDHRRGPPRDRQNHRLQSHRSRRTAPGADLPRDAAREIAAAFAAPTDGTRPRWISRRTTSEKKKARRDYTLIWEARSGDARNVEEAKLSRRDRRFGRPRHARRAPIGSCRRRGRARPRAAKRDFHLAHGAAHCGFGCRRGVGLWLLIRKSAPGRVRWRNASSWPWRRRFCRRLAGPLFASASPSNLHHRRSARYLPGDGCTRR